MKYLLAVLFYIMRINLALDEHGENVCPRLVKTNLNKTYVVPECCPDYHEQNGTCKECPPGKYGKRCTEKCFFGKYGPKCKLDCKCGPREHCDLVDGCVCNTGNYGLKCQLDCDCGPREHCDPVNGCVCNAGFTGDNCSLECEAGTYGVNCSQTCDCTGSCDHVTGNCNHSFVTKTTKTDIQDQESMQNVTSYVLMVSVITGLIALVMAVIKVKEYVMSCYNRSKKEEHQLPVEGNGYDIIDHP